VIKSGFFEAFARPGVYVLAFIGTSDGCSVAELPVAAGLSACSEIHQSAASGKFSAALRWFSSS
jgi:hypothetical protein